MDWLPSLRDPSSTDDGFSDRSVKAWTVRHSSTGSAGGWASVDGWDALDTPPTKTEFEINTGELDAGTYRLFWIEQDTERLQLPPDDIAWKLTIEDDTPAVEPEPDLDPDAIAEKAAKQAVSAIQDGGQSPLLELADEPADLLVLMNLFNDDFVGAYGEQAALKQLGLIGGSELGFDEYQDNPIGAFFFDSYKDPQQLQDLGRNLGAGGSAFFDGILSGAEDPESVLRNDIEDAEQRAGDAADREPSDIEKRHSRAGSLTLNDLGVDKPGLEAVAETMTADSAPSESSVDGPDAGEGDGDGAVPSVPSGGEERSEDGGADSEEGSQGAGVVSGSELTDEEIDAIMEDLDDGE